MININYLYLITLVLFVGCIPNVLFKEALPPDIQAISEFPIEMIGTYVCESDGNIIEITKEAIIKEEYYTVTMPITEIGQSETCAIVDGSLHIEGRQECIPFTYVSEDTISAQVFDLDTLFSTQTSVLKMYRGHLFVNTLGSDKAWITFMVSHGKYGDLIWKLILVPDEIEQINEITSDVSIVKSEEDKMEKYIINPSLKEFDYILNKDFTIECEQLTPIRPLRPY